MPFWFALTPLTRWCHTLLQGTKGHGEGHEVRLKKTKKKCRYGFMCSFCCFYEMSPLPQHMLPRKRIFWHYSERKWQLFRKCSNFSRKLRNVKIPKSLSHSYYFAFGCIYAENILVWNSPKFMLVCFAFFRFYFFRFLFDNIRCCCFVHLALVESSSDNIVR